MTVVLSTVADKERGEALAMTPCEASLCSLFSYDQHARVCAGRKQTDIGLRVWGGEHA